MGKSACSGSKTNMNTVKSVAGGKVNTGRKG